MCVCVSCANTQLIWTPPQATDTECVEDARVVGGMRKLHRFARLSSVVHFGSRPYDFIDSIVSECPALQHSTLGALGSEDLEPRPSETHLHPYSAGFAKLLSVSNRSKVHDDDFSTHIRVCRLARRLAQHMAAVDPHTVLPFYTSMEYLQGCDDTRKIVRSSREQILAPQRQSISGPILKSFRAHASVEPDDLACEEFIALTKCVWLCSSQNLHTVTAYLGEAPVLGKCGMSSKDWLAASSRG